MPAEPGGAKAVAAEVGTLLAIGRSEATAGPAESEAKGHAIEIGGTPRVGGTTGKQAGSNAAKGAILDTGTTPLGRLAIAPWEASTSGDGTSGSPRTATGKAALLRVILGANTVNLNVLQSESTATHDGMDSTGAASSDGATLGLLNNPSLQFTVLHAEAKSSGQGDAYLLGIGTTKIGTQSQVRPLCERVPAQLVRLVCLDVVGGTGKVHSTVLDAKSPLPIPAILLVSAQGAGVGGLSLEEPRGPDAIPEDNGGPKLPVTGSDSAGFLTLVGMAFVLLGAAVAMLSRRLPARVVA